MRRAGLGWRGVAAAAMAIGLLGALWVVGVKRVDEAESMRDSAAIGEIASLHQWVDRFGQTRAAR